LENLCIPKNSAVLGLLRSEYWQFVTDVSGQPLGPKGCPETSVRN